MLIFGGFSSKMKKINMYLERKLKVCFKKLSLVFFCRRLRIKVRSPFVIFSCTPITGQFEILDFSLIYMYINGFRAKKNNVIHFDCAELMTVL